MGIEDRIDLVEKLALELQGLIVSRNQAAQLAREILDHESLKLVRFMVDENKVWPSDMLIGLFAREAADDFIADVNKRNNNPALPKPEKPKADSEITFGKFIETRWKAYTRQAKHQVSSLASQNCLIKKHLLPVFGEMRMKDVQPSDISDFFDAKLEKGLANNTLLSLYTLLHQNFDLAEQYDLIDRTPVRPKLHRPQKVKVEKPTLTAEQIRAVLSALADEQERLFCLILAVTGMRMGEGLALRWVDFTPSTCQLFIRHTLYNGKLKSPKTKASKSVFRLEPPVAGLLVWHRGRSSFQAPEDFIFCGRAGNPLQSIVLRKNLYEAMDTLKGDLAIKRSERQHGFHIFRHSAGTIVYDKSRDLKLVQGTLRHNDISTTSDIYVHLNDKILREGTAILTAEILGNCDLFVTQKSEMVS
jgi:integrase